MFLQRVHKLFLILLVPFALVGMRLFHLQVVHGARPRDPAERVTMERGWVDTPRGRILDRAGRELARDEVGFNVLVDYLYIHPDGERLKREVKRRVPAARRKDPKAAAEAKAAFLAEVQAYWFRLSVLTGQDPAVLAKARDAVVRVVERTRRRVCEARGAEVETAEELAQHAVVFGLDKAAAMAIETAEPRLPGLRTEPARSRSYPMGDLAPHLIGYTAPVGKRELERPLSREDPAGYTGKDTAGKSGVEAGCEARLRGARGWWERPAKPVPGVEGRAVEPVAGRDVVLTLDADVQEAVEDLLDRKGAVVVLDVRTGGVIAAATWPRYDLNTFRQPEIYRELTAEGGPNPLLNRALNPYAPGSTIKPVIGIAALQSGSVTEGERLPCTGRWGEGGGFSCWIWSTNRSGHGPLSLPEAIARSCNHWFFHAAMRTGGERVAAYAKRAGLGSRTGIEVPGEGAGLFPDHEWLSSRQGRNGQGWTDADVRLASIGQGPVLASPLQIADLAATIARGGTRMRPHLVEDADVKAEDLGFAPWAVRVVQRGMREAVETRAGLVYDVLRMPGLRVGAKTGSAQVWQMRDGRMQLGDPHCWVMGWAGADAPRVAFAVMLENVPGGSGGKSAGPVARRVLEVLQTRGWFGPSGGDPRRGGSLASPGR